ncbi:MAG: hypothetical protein K9J06_10895 [Flavobacteriales bacterium]|nr:hypothetical protein [Flavobacteriales bacterium]
MAKPLQLATIVLCLGLAANTASAQDGVLIDYVGTTRDASAILDVRSATQGVMVPRVALTTGTGSAAPVAAPAASLLIYNTATVGDVTPGYYYWNGTGWTRLMSGNTTPLTGTGTADYLARWTSTTGLSIGATRDNGTDVGIGIAPGTYRLNVNGTTQSSTYYVNHGSGNVLEVGDDAWIADINMANTVGISGQQAASNGGLRLGTNGAAYLYSDGTANIGVGTTGPGAKLHVAGGGQILGTNGTSSATRTLTILEDGDAQINFGSYPGSWTSALQIQNNDNTDYIWMSPLQDGSNARMLASGSGLDFHVGANAFAATITEAGNVGIGTTGPGRKLEVNGDIKLAYGYQIYFGENVSANGKIGINFHTDGDPNYGIYKPAGAWTQPLHIGFYTGVRIGANSGYGGTRIYNSSNMATQIMSMGDGDNNVRVNYALYTPITYDLDNSAYYLDPSATSNTQYWTGRAKAGMGNTGKYTTPRWDYTTDVNYWTGAMGWGTTDLNTVATWGSGFFDSWSSPANGPGTTSHYVGLQTFHYTAGENNAYGWQMVGTTNTNRFHLRTAWPNWQPWVEMITTANVGSYGDNLGNHTATTTLNMNWNHINNVADIYAVNNYGQGLMGVYSSTVYQNVFAMSNSYRLPANGSTPGNLYGLAWTHTNVGGQSKPGLSHQLLVMENGVTKVALGSGIWTGNTSYIPFIYDTDNTGYYLDPNSTSRTSTEITDNDYTYGWFRNYSANSGLYHQSYGNHWYATGGNYWNIGGAAGTNTGIVFRNGHQGAIQGYSYSDGSGFGLLHSSGGWAVRTTPGVTEAYQPFYASTSYIPFIYDRDNTGYYMDPNSTSRMYYGDYNYLHTQTNDSWFPYTGNNWNYFRGNSYINNAVWYDENNSGYYMDLNSGNRLAYLYHGVGAYNVGGWTSGRIQTESTSDGHQYHPLTGNWGFIGTSGQYWYYSYAMSHVNMSQRKLKRDITPVDETLSSFVMDDIDRIKPSFYKVKEETDELEKGNEPKYRPNMHLGVILDESPDYIQDQAFSGIDIYAMATMGIVGVKHNRQEIKEIKDAIGMTGQKVTISDFGNEALNSNETWVAFDADFVAKNTTGVAPIVTITPNQMGVMLSVTETTAKGFKVQTDRAQPCTFNWMAMAKVSTAEATETVGKAIPAELMGQLRVDESRKAPIKAYWEEQKRIGQDEHARQKAEQERTVEIGKKNYMETVNKESEKPAITENPFVPADGPARQGLLPDANESKEGAPKVIDVRPTPADPVPAEAPASELPASHQDRKNLPE